MITSFTSVGNLTSATIAAITITTTTHTVTNIQYAGASSLSCMQASNF